MASLGGSRGDRPGAPVFHKPSLASPEKVRELLSEGVSTADGGSSSESGNGKVLEAKGNIQGPSEATNKEAFFSRVESYSSIIRLSSCISGKSSVILLSELFLRPLLKKRAVPPVQHVLDIMNAPSRKCLLPVPALHSEHARLKWAGKPRVLSPLMCARYGWINVGSDMLKCSSCQAFLCASLKPMLDFDKYETRIAEISRQLQTQHEKFCPWPDFPCPDRIWLVPACEPSSLLTAFLERFQSACLLAHELPAMKPEPLKSMSLTEDVISVILQLIEEELKRKGRTPSAEPLAVQVAACIVSLCGWEASPSLHAMSLPILTCSYCMRKVGLWNFHQMKGIEGDGDASPNAVGTSEPTSGPAPAATTQEGQGDHPTPPSPTPTPPAAAATAAAAATPCRMKLRSQDSTRSDQGEGTSSPAALRARSRDSPSPSEELQSPLTRGKRPATRSRGQGDGPGSDGAANVHPPKRLCLFPSSGPDGLIHRNAFDPLGQHRDWCPWVSIGKENMDPRSVVFLDGESGLHQQGWKAALDLFMPTKKNSITSSPAHGPRDKSKRVFAIFRQWQISSSSQ